MKRFSGVLCTVFAAMLVVGASSALAGVTRVVGNTVNACSAKATFTTIQAAVNASASSDKIKVCAGTYPEQVSIPAGKNNLTLVSDQHWLAIIQAPAAMTSPKAIVRVNGAQNATISDFTIQGPGDGGCDSLENGVRIDAGGSASVLDNHIANIRDNPFSGCQNGVGIQAGRSADSTTGTVTAKDNLIDGYQKNGITISNTGSMGTIAGNTITGAGPTGVIAQNGIQVSTGAAASIRDNTVSGNRYSDPSTDSTGILLYGPLGAVTVATNHVSGSNIGIYTFIANAATSITGNTVGTSTSDGITLYQDVASTVNGNTTSNGRQGIGVYATTNSKLYDNVITSSSAYGLYVGADSNGNSFLTNKVSGSGGDNCHDNSVGAVSFGTANTWKKNISAPSTPLGICA